MSVTVIATGFDEPISEEKTAFPKEREIPRRRTITDDDTDLDIPPFLRSRDDF